MVDKPIVNFVQDRFWDSPLNSQKIPNGLHTSTLEAMEYLISKEIPTHVPTGFKGSGLQTIDLWKVFDLDKDKTQIIYPNVWNSSFFNQDKLINETFDFKFHLIDDITDEQDLFYVVEILGGFSNAFSSHLGIYKDKNTKEVSQTLRDVYDMGNLFTNIFSKSLELIRNGRMKLVMSYMHEGTVETLDFKKLHDALDTNKISPNSVIVITGSANFISRYDIWCDENSIKEKFKTLESIHYVEDTARVWDKKGIKYKEALKRESIFRKNYFLSYNGLVDNHKVHRALLLASFVHNDLLDKGLLSCLTKTFDYSDIIQKMNERYKNDDSDLVERFKTSFVKLENKIPIYLDFEYDYTDANDDRKNSSLLGNNNFRDSYFSIVTESIAWGDSIFISEKLLKPVSNLHPFIVMAPQHYLKHLHKLGFKTFHPFIDESYDDIEDPIKRYVQIGEEVKRLCSLPIEEIHDWYYSILKPTLVHNKELHISYGLKSERVDFINFLLEN